MANNAERGRTNITSALENGLKKAHENRPISMLPQIWTDYKKDELANIYKGKGTQKRKGIGLRYPLWYQCQSEYYMG